jgi:outer membrane protein assembly factor BamB
MKEKLTRGGKLDDTSDKSNGDMDLRSRVTVDHTAEWTALSGKSYGSSRVTVYDSAGWTALGEMNKLGVTRYQNHAIERRRREDGKFFWPDSVNREGEQLHSGAKDLVESVSWGWRHPSSLYGTIPVGSPLIDDSMNIYLGSDDAVRKFDTLGNIIWSYAPRGQLAAAPTLSTGCAPTRQAAHVLDDITSEEEEMLRPDWAKGTASDTERSLQFLGDFKVGDLVKVKAGASYRADGMELYSASDQGLISGVVPDEDGKYNIAVIQWTRTGRKSAVQFDAMRRHFVRVEPKVSTTCTPMLIGSTTSGFVFAIDLASGLEQWVLQGSYQIAGVKGALAAKDGIVVLATNRCTDRYCYRYRNQTNTLTPGNTVVRGLNAVDGSQVWAYVPRAPVWNMSPVWGPNGSVFFNDQEGRLYCLELATGVEIWHAGGEIGTYTEAAAVYDTGSHHNVYASACCPTLVRDAILM